MKLSQALAAAVPNAHVSDRETDREAYSRDLWPRRLLELRSGEGRVTPPGAIIWPSNTEDVAATIDFARRRGVPVVPFGAGSGVCGGVLPTPEAIVLDLKRLDQIECSTTEPTVTAGAGALGITFEQRLAERGLTAGNFPSSILCSTLGGWVATRSAGQCSGKYGKIEDMVAELEFVSGRGDIVKLRRRRGLDLTRLVVGSEGTLGVVTKVTLRSHPAPQRRAFQAFAFPDITQGWSALRQLFQNGLRPAVSRLYDPLDSFMLKKGPVEHATGRATAHDASAFIEDLVKNLKLGRERAKAALLRQALAVPSALYQALKAGERGWLARAILVLVFEGDAEVAGAAATADALCRDAAGTALGEAPARAWLEHRYAVSYRQSAVFRAGAFSDTMEVAAPWSRLEALYASVRAALSKHALVMSHLSHAYPDGCSIYFTFVGAEPDDARALAKYDLAWSDALSAVNAAGGTLSHHHGVGRSKAPRLASELGAGLGAVRRLLHTWDPAGIMNPGNLLPLVAPPRLEPTPQAGKAAEPGAFELDVTSQLLSCGTQQRLGDVETRLNATGHTLGLSAGLAPELTLRTWLAQGTPGLPSAWDDPVAQTLAGYRAELRAGGAFQVRPAPRRAVGPDLSALFLGAGEGIGHIEQAVLRVAALSAPRSPALGPVPSEMPPSSEEQALFTDLCRAFETPV